LQGPETFEISEKWHGSEYCENYFGIVLHFVFPEWQVEKNKLLTNNKEVCSFKCDQEKVKELSMITLTFMKIRHYNNIIVFLIIK